MAKPFDVSDDRFDEEVLRANSPVLVDFWAPWCGPCQPMGAIVKELADEYGDRMKFAKLNVDGNPKVSSRYGIQSIPTLLVFKDGKPMKQIIGLRPKAELKKQLDQLLG